MISYSWYLSFILFRLQFVIMERNRLLVIGKFYTHRRCILFGLKNVLFFTDSLKKFPTINHSFVAYIECSSVGL